MREYTIAALILFVGMISVCAATRAAYGPRGGSSASYGRRAYPSQLQRTPSLSRAYADGYASGGSGSSGGTTVVEPSYEPPPGDQSPLDYQQDTQPYPPSSSQ